jgi:hypothetical protein
VTVGFWDPATLAGGRVLYAGPGENASVRECPAGTQPYPRVELAAEPVVTFPGFEHPDLQATFLTPGEDLRSFLNHPVNDEAFLQALTDRRPGPCHQVGGYAAPVQGPVEYEAAAAALGTRNRGDDPELQAEQAQWTLLAQIDSDDGAGMMWGDCGCLYWLARRAEMTDSHLAHILHLAMRITGAPEWNATGQRPIIPPCLRHGRTTARADQQIGSGRLPICQSLPTPDRGWRSCETQSMITERVRAAAWVGPNAWQAGNGLLAGVMGPRGRGRWWTRLAKRLRPRARPSCRRR